MVENIFLLRITIDKYTPNNSFPAQRVDDLKAQTTPGVQYTVVMNDTR